MLTEEQKQNRREACRRWRFKNAEKARELTRKWYAANREKADAATKRWRANHPTKTAEWGREYRKRNPDYNVRKYGLSAEDFESFKEKQNGKCAICLRTVALCVDHSHDTGKVRGLLCRQCNAVLGIFGDSVARFVRAAGYLLEGQDRVQGG